MSLLATTTVLGMMWGASRHPGAPDPDRVTGLVVAGSRMDIRDYSVPGADPSLDYSASLVLAGVVRSSRLTLRATYAPSFVYQRITTPGQQYYSLQQAGSLGLSYIVPLRRFTLTMGVDGSVAWSAVPVSPYIAGAAPPVQAQANAPAMDANGMQQTQTPTAAPPPQAPVNTIGGTVIPYNVVLQTGNLRAIVGSTYLFTRRLSLGDSITGYTAGGFAFTNASAYNAQLYAPINRGGTIAASLSYLLTKHDRLSTTASSSYTVVLPVALTDGTPQPSSNTVIATVSEGYNHTFSNRMNGNISAGYSVATSKTEGRSRDNESSVVADASLSYVEPLARDSTLLFRAAAHYGLVVNVYAGAAQPYASGTGFAGWRKQRFSVNASIDFSSTIDSSPETQTVTGSGTIAYVPAPLVQLLIGASLQRAIIPAQNAAIANQFNAAPYPNDSLQWAVFAAVSVAAPILSF